MRLKLFFSIITIIFTLPLAATPSSAATDGEQRHIVQNLHWRAGGQYGLGGSTATLIVDPRFWVVTGADARSLVQAVDPANATPGVEAVIGDYEAQGIVEYRSVRDGLVTFEDWKTVDADRMMAEAIDAGRSARPAPDGTKPMRVTGWYQRPYLDSVARTVHWAIEGEVRGQRILNVVTLVFGRFGYEQLTWSGPASETPWPLLTTAADAFSFSPEARYQDFRAGDAVAPYGVGALAATAIEAANGAKPRSEKADAASFTNAWPLGLLLPAALWWSARRSVKRPRAPKPLNA